MLKIILISASLLTSPLAFGCGGEKSASHGKTAQFSGCANEGGNCNAQTPCCGDNSCVRGRCQYVPPTNAELAGKQASTAQTTTDKKTQ